MPAKTTAPPVWGKSTTLASFGPSSAEWRCSVQLKDGHPVYALRCWFEGNDGIDRPSKDGIYFGSLERFTQFAELLTEALEAAAKE